MNRVQIRYAYPTSPMSVELGVKDKGGFYVEIGIGIYSAPFKTLAGAEGYCRNHSIAWEPHGFPIENFTRGKQ